MMGSAMRSRWRCGWKPGCPSGGRLRLIAGSTSDALDTPGLAAGLVAIDKTYGDFRLLEITDLTGEVLASSRPEDTVDLTGEDWFRNRRRRAARDDVVGAAR